MGPFEAEPLMPSPLSFRDVARALRNHGWTLDRIRGSHFVFVKEGEPLHICIPVHQGQVKPKYVKLLETKHGIRL